jgi:hypothetical protein
MHWGIFVGKRDKPSRGIPYTGTLFHASGNCLTCLAPCNGTITRETTYRIVRNFHPTQSSNLDSFLLLSNTNVNVDTVQNGCARVTKGRNWNMLTSNCQVWVNQALNDLVMHGHISNSIWGEMRANRWRTLPQISADSRTGECCSIQQIKFTVVPSGPVLPGKRNQFDCDPEEIVGMPR